MNPIEYLNSLIEASKVSSIPVQTSELELLMKLLLLEQSK